MEEKKQISGIVYCIRELSSNAIIYIGSTTSKLSSRISSHKSDCYFAQRKTPIYEYIRSIATTKDQFDKYFVFDVLQSDTYQSAKELRKDENNFIANTPNLLNTMKSFQTKEELREYMKKYRSTHREQNKDYHREYRKSEKQLEYHREYMREYYRKKNNHSMNV